MRQRQEWQQSLLPPCHHFPNKSPTCISRGFWYPSEVAYFFHEHKHESIQSQCLCECPVSGQFYVPTPHVPDYLVWAILATIFCCQPFGIVAIVFSALTISAKQRGDFQTAIENAKKTKLFLLISVFAQLISFIAVVCFLFLGAIMGALQ